MKKSLLMITLFSSLFLFFSCYADKDPMHRHYETHSIVVLGGDVYVAGFYETTDFVEHQCYWKNNVRIEASLEDDLRAIVSEYGSSNTLNFAFAKLGTEGGGWQISHYAIVNEDIYKLPSIASGNYLKNDIEVPFNLDVIASDFSSITMRRTYSLFVAGSDVYIAGFFYGIPVGDTQTYPYGYLWKNGAVEYRQGNNYAGIQVDGSDVYILSRLEGGDCIYKNGVLIESTGVNEIFESMRYENGVLYILGYLDGWPFYMANGVRTILHTPREVGNAYLVGQSLFVDNGDVYCTGWQETEGTYGYWEETHYSFPFYLKNGVTAGLRRW